MVFREHRVAQGDRLGPVPAAPARGHISLRAVEDRDHRRMESPTSSANHEAQLRRTEQEIVRQTLGAITSCSFSFELGTLFGILPHDEHGKQFFAPASASSEGPGGSLDVEQSRVGHRR